MPELIINAANSQSSTLYSLSEVCSRCGLHAELIVEMVEYGVLEPADTDVDKHWLFAAETLMRLDRAQRLRQDLGLNLAGLALSMDLLDQIDTLRRQVASLQHQLQQLHGREYDVN